MTMVKHRADQIPSSSPPELAGNAYPLPRRVLTIEAAADDSPKFVIRESAGTVMNYSSTEHYHPLLDSKPLWQGSYSRLPRDRITQGKDAAKLGKMHLPTDHRQYETGAPAALDDAVLRPFDLAHHPYSPNQQANYARGRVSSKFPRPHPMHSNSQFQNEQHRRAAVMDRGTAVRDLSRDRTTRVEVDYPASSVAASKQLLFAQSAALEPNAMPKVIRAPPSSKWGEAQQCMSVNEWQECRPEYRAGGAIPAKRSHVAAGYGGAHDSIAASTRQFALSNNTDTSVPTAEPERSYGTSTDVLISTIDPGSGLVGNPLHDERWKAENGSAIYREVEKLATAVTCVHACLERIHPMSAKEYAQTDSWIAQNEWNDPRNASTTREILVVQDPQHGHVAASMKDVATEVTPRISRRDMGTEMTPLGSSRISICQSPRSASSPARHNTPIRTRLGSSAGSMAVGRVDLEELENCHLAKLQLQGLMSAGRGCHSSDRSLILNWSTREEEEADIGRSLRRVDSQELRQDVLEARAAAWEEEARSKCVARYEREESEIQAWEDQKKSQAEAELRRLELKLERMKLETTEKIANKLSAAHQRAEQRRTLARARHLESLSRSSNRADQLRREANRYCTCFSAACQL